MNKSDNSGNWETYIAMYENDIPGSTTVRLELLEISPVKNFPVVVETGLRYNSNENDGFPNSQDLEMLHQLSSKIEILFKNNGEHIFVGSFMSDGNRLEYYYISEVGDIENKLQQFYTETYPNNEHEINIVKDKKWSYYKDFLYPNEETLAFMTDEKLVTQIHNSGDNTTKSRKIIHWLHFKSERKMYKCKTILVKEGFTFESQTFNREANMPYELQISNNGPIIMDSIHDTTRLLNEISRDFKGKYGGWETSFVK